MFASVILLWFVVAFMIVVRVILMFYVMKFLKKGTETLKNVDELINRNKWSR